MKTLRSERKRILSTKDYSLFNVRKEPHINNQHLEVITSLIEQKNISPDIPIVVDDEYNILDGRYRFLACKNLGFDIHYKVAEVAELKDFLLVKDYHRKLTLKEYALCYQDKIAYRKLLETSKSLPFSINTCLKIIYDLNGSHNRKVFQDFKKGEFEYIKEYTFRASVLSNLDKYWKELFGEDQIIDSTAAEMLLFDYSFNLDRIKEVINPIVPILKMFFDCTRVGAPCQTTTDGIIKEFTSLLISKGYYVTSSFNECPLSLEDIILASKKAEEDNLKHWAWRDAPHRQNGITEIDHGGDIYELSILHKSIPQELLIEDTQGVLTE